MAEDELRLAFHNAVPVPTPFSFDKPLKNIRRSTFFGLCLTRLTDRVCTIGGSEVDSCTSVVRKKCAAYRGLFAAAVFAGTLGTELDAMAAGAGAAGRQERQQAQGWLQLKQDRKTFRESVEPLTPGQADRLDRLELRERDRARQLEQQQRRSLNSERNLRRRVEVDRPGARPRGLEEQRQLDRQRLDMRTQREIQRPGRY